MPSKRRGCCEICHGPRAAGHGVMCKACGRSYDRDAHADGSVLEAMVWAANRARRAERIRAATQARTLTVEVSAQPEAPEYCLRPRPSDGSRCLRVANHSDDCM